VKQRKSSEQSWRDRIFDADLVLLIVIWSEKIILVGCPSRRLVALFDAVGPSRIGRDLVERLVDQTDSWADDAVRIVVAGNSAGGIPAFRVQERRADDAL